MNSPTDNSALANSIPPKKESNETFLDRKSLLKSRLTEWSLTSTFHCYPKIFQTKNVYAKILWTLFFLVFSCLTFMLVIKCLTDFLEFDVVSKIRINSQEASLFPTLTICWANPLTTQEAERLVYEVDQLPREYYNSSNVSFLLEARLHMDDLLNYAFGRAFFLDDTQKQKLSFSMEKVIQYCNFNKYPCNYSDFTWEFNYKWGNCFKFNPNTSKECRVSGRTNGFELSLGPLVNANKYNTFHSTGLRLFIHNGSFLSTSAQEIFVKSGEQTSIALKKTLTHKASWPYSECVDLSDFHSDVYDYIHALNSEYRQRDCLDLCLQSIIVESCQCFMTVLPKFGNSPSCSNLEQFNCSRQFFYRRHTEKIATMCNSKCPLECDYVTYEWSLSTLDYPSAQFFEDVLNKSNHTFGLSFEEFKKTHVLMNVFYPTLEHTDISEAAKISFIDLVSNMGGAFGIFLGFSIFSLIEIGEIIAQLFYLCFIKKK